MAVNGFDLVVVGAGPAGSAAAMAARRAGLSVALVDKAAFPRDKLCGALISGRALRALDRIFPTRPPREMFQLSRDVAWLWNGTELARFQAPYDLWFTMRRHFDHALLQTALEAGAQDCTGRRWRVLDALGGRLEMADGEVLEFQLLIAADGAASPVAARLFGRAFDPDRIGFALECEAPRAEGAQVLEIDCRLVPWGYGWRFPKRDSLTIGVGGLHRLNPDMMAAQRKLMQGHARGSEKIKGAFLPFGDYRKVPGQGRVLLAGDAAGLVDPLTGEGIAYALESGALAASAAAEALAAGNPTQALSRYRHALKPLHADLSRAVRLRQIAYSGRFEALLREKLAGSETISRMFFELLEGNVSYRDLEKRVARATLNRLGHGARALWPGRAPKA